MKASARRVAVWSVYCRDQGHSSSIYRAEAYGDWIGYTPVGEYAEFDVFEGDNETFFNDVSSTLRSVLQDCGREAMLNSYLQDALGWTLDPAPSGRRYYFGGRVQCPTCGSLNVAYGPFVPPQFEVIELQLSTHQEWDSLDASQKRTYIRECIAVLR